MTDQTLKDIDRAFKALEERDELLDKIRAEIAEEQNDCMVKEQIDTAYGLQLALWIIDKYKGERSEKE
jgi:hypothetical protein